MQRLKTMGTAVRSWTATTALRASLWMQTAGTRWRSDTGQTVAEYALVLLVVAAIAVAFLVWAKQSGKLDGFFDAIFAKLLSSVDAESTPAP